MSSNSGVKSVMRDNRLCANCGTRLVRNPDNPKKWVHNFDGGKKCRLPIGEGKTAQPIPITLSSDITMVMCNNRLFRRERAFFPDIGGEDLWSDWSPGSSAVTIEEILDKGDVFVVHLGRQL